MNKLSLIVIVLILMTFQSCNYHWTRISTINGDRIWVRKFKDYKKEMEFEDRKVFKNKIGEQTYIKYSGKIVSDTVQGSRFIEFDSIRVYLFFGTDKFNSIFTSGLISGQFIYCKIDSTCRSPETRKIINSKTGQQVNDNLYDWAGHSIIVEIFEELKELETKPTQKRFKFWAFPYEYLGSGSYVFLLELTNEKADKNTDLETFIKGSKVTLLKKARTII